MIIIWLSVKEGTPARGYWDQKLLEGIFKGQSHIETNFIDPQREAIVVIPGAYQAPFIDEINEQIAKVEKCTVIITSDEENNFPIDELSHNNMRVFASYYNPKYKSKIRWIPIGAANVFSIDMPEKSLNFVFAGQVTSPQRVDYVDELRKRRDGLLAGTRGFAQGMDPRQYYATYSTAKVAPSPAGNISPDAFRTYEAIHAGAVPVATDVAWHQAVFGSVPFPVIDSFSQVNGYIDDALAKYPALNNQVQMWWLRYVRELKNELLPPEKEGVTVIMPVSPIKSHPGIDIMSETIMTIRKHLPHAEIIVTFDGVRDEQEDRRADYEEAKRALLWKTFHDSAYANILPISFSEHSHQVKMAREALKLVQTDLVLYCEQDTPLTPDQTIEWSKCADLIRSGEANMIRFHFETFIPEPHEHMMIGKPENGFLKTFQWSQRPHLISKAYFERVLKDYFSEDAVTFVEDKMHSVLHESCRINGMQGWYQHRVWIYHPSGSIKRSYHTDGRAGEEKYDKDLIF